MLPLSDRYGPVEASRASTIGKGIVVNSLNSGRLARILDKLHQGAEAADRDYMAEVMADIEASGATLEQVIAEKLAEERADYRTSLSRPRRQFSCRLADLRPLPLCDRARLQGGPGSSSSARRWASRPSISPPRCGTMAAVISSARELEPAKVARARRQPRRRRPCRPGGHPRRRRTRDAQGCRRRRCDLLLIDGAFSLYLPVLKLIEPRLTPGAVILGENAFDPGYLDYVRNPANGYLSQPLPLDEGRGNEFTVRTA